MPSDRGVLTAQVDAAPYASVARSVLTLGIEEREPVQDLPAQIPDDVGQLTYFTELLGLEGQRVLHRWLYKNRVISEVAFEVRGQRWRVWSRKRIAPTQAGIWFVQVLDGQGRVLAEDRFEVITP